MCCQGGDLCADGVDGLVVGCESIKRVVMRVPLASGCCRGCIQSAGVCGLNKRLEVWPSLVCFNLTIPFIIEISRVESGGKEKTNGVVDELLGGIRVVTQYLYLLAILDPAEQYFRGICWRVWRPVKLVVCQQRSRSGATIRVRKLVEDVHDFHGSVPPHNGRNVGDFKRVIDAVIEDSEAHAFNVLVGLVVVSLPDESGVDCCLLSTAE